MRRKRPDDWLERIRRAREARETLEAQTSESEVTRKRQARAAEAMGPDMSANPLTKYLYLLQSIATGLPTLFPYSDESAIWSKLRQVSSRDRSLVRAEMGQWIAILRRLQKTPDDAGCQAAANALMRRGIPEQDAIRAVETVLRGIHATRSKTPTPQTSRTPEPKSERREQGTSAEAVPSEAPEIPPSAPPDQSSLVTQAQALYEAQQWTEAAAIYRRLLDAGDHVADALYGLGMIALVGGGDLAAAERFFLRALQVNPTDANSIYRLGELAEQAGSRERAVALYGAALSYNPNHAAAGQRLVRLLGAPASAGARPQPSPAPPQSGSPQGATQPEPTPPRRPRHVVGSRVGIARNVTGETKWNKQILTFDLEEHVDGAIRTTPVRLEGAAIRGSLSSGQEVEIPPDAKRAGSTLLPKKINNLSTRWEVVVAPFNFSPEMRRAIRLSGGPRLPPGRRPKRF